MGSQTATWAMPYPLGTDRVMDGDNAIQSLAEAVDYRLTQNLKTSPIQQTNYPAVNGWSGSVALFRRNGVGMIYFNVNKAGWAANEAILLPGTLPMPYVPYLTLYGFYPTTNTGIAKACALTSDGGLYVVVTGTAGDGGVIGHFTYQGWNTTP